MVGIAYELESLKEECYRKGSATFLMGYRVGLLSAGGIALYIAYLFEWSWVFAFLSLLLFIGSIFIFFQREPFKSHAILKEKREELLQYNSLMQSFWHEIILKPCKAFLQRKDWLVIIFVITTFNIGDNMAKVMEGPFCMSLGFNKADLATATNMWGFCMAICGAFVAGFFFKKTDLLRSTVALGAIHAFTLMSYYVLTIVGKSFFFLYMTAALDHFTAGMAMTIITCFLWRICDKRYIIVQYALFWSLYTFKADIFACAGGFLAAFLPWNLFFSLTACFSVLAALLMWKFVRNSSSLVVVTSHS